jgi:alkanesulfonate monooxygenase SsuD/methylene tetrahydromethanopterin reductase-like flavin-dependent oxidoreductase (luciferase family)
MDEEEMTMPATPKLGIILPEGEGDLDGRTPRWSDYVAMARLTEEAGFDSLWFVDHLIYRNDASGRPPQGAWECWSVIAALAAATSRVELGSLVTATSFRNPALLAKMTDTIDEISGGRLILGLGAGWNEVEYQMFGFPFDHRVDRFAEAFTIISGLLRDGQIDFEGRYYSARECELRPRGPRSGGPPIMVGSQGPRMLRLTLPHVPMWNGWLCDSSSYPDAYPPLRELVDGACREVGRDPATVERTVSISVDPSGRREFPEHWYLEGDLATARPLTGSREEIAEGIRAFGAQGVAHLQIYPIPPTLTTIETLAPISEEARRSVPDTDEEHSSHRT